jgi:hypothetical protein
MAGAGKSMVERSGASFDGAGLLIGGRGF